MKFEIPVWNGVKAKKFKQKIASLNLQQSHKGIFVQKNKRVIDYTEDYTHMTALNWSGFLKNVRDNKINFVLKNIKHAGDCLEIGAGDDFNMKILKWNTYTICDPFLKSESRKKIEIIGKDFEKIKFKKKFDTIIMFAVLEHCDSFEKFLLIARNLLKKNGRLFIEIPIVDNHFLDGDFNCLLHEHITYFFSSGINNFIKKNKMFIKNFYNKNDSSYICVTKNNNKKNLFTDKFIYKLKFYEKIFKLKIKNFYNFLRKNKDRKIAFYGATNGINSLLFFANKKGKINVNNIFITDSDKNKWGKYIGSFDKKISKPTILKKCELICISSLSFRDEIISNLKKDKPIIDLNDI